MDPISPNPSPTSSPYITAPSTPKHPSDQFESRADDLDLTFEFSVDHFHSFSLPAEDLFDGGKIRTLKPPTHPDPSNPPPTSLQNADSQTKRKIIWSSRRSFDFSESRTLEINKTASFLNKGSSRLNKLINILAFRRQSVSEPGSSSSSKTSASFGSSSSESGSGGDRGYFSGSGTEEGKSCLAPCKQRLLSCFVRKL